MQDGTSKVTIYKPVEEELKNDVKETNYLTKDEFKKALENFDNKDIIRDVRELKKQFKDMSRDIEDLKEKE